MLVEMFSEMVQIDSESGEEERFINYLKDWLEKELGARPRLDSYGNLICRIDAKASTAEPLMLAAHADTVKPGRGITPVVEEGIIRSQGETILGADDKAGIAEIFAAVRTAVKHPPLEIVITRSEEVGLLGAKNLDYSMLSAKRGFLLDSDVLDTVVIGGPSHFLIDVNITGKAAHAGMEPEKGISAIRTAALAIAKFPEGRIDEETTCNVGIIQGGTIRNGIPEKTTLKAECRSLDHEKAVRLKETIKDAFKSAARETGAHVEIDVDLASRAIQLSEDAPTVELTKAVFGSLGLQPKARVITGGTDASIYNEHGIETVVLGIGVKNEHSKDEQIAIEDMERVVEILHCIFERTA